MPYPKKPTVIKELEGTSRKDRMNAAEPEVRPELLECPGHLTGIARWAFEHIAENAFGMRVASRHDRLVMEAAAQAYADFRRACEILDENGGPIIETRRLDAEGNVVITDVRKHPAVDAQAVADKRLRQCLAAFGMTPADRSRVSAMSGGSTEAKYNAARKRVQAIA